MIVFGASVTTTAISTVHAAFTFKKLTVLLTAVIEVSTRGVSEERKNINPLE